MLITGVRLALLPPVVVLGAVCSVGTAAAAEFGQACPFGGYAAVACPVITDDVTRDAIISRLAGSVSSACYPVAVQVEGGAVMLSGYVDDAAKISLATILATSVRGVGCVDNRLAVCARGASDKELVGAVKTRLAKEMFRAPPITVRATDGVVQLSGTVASDVDREQAAMVAGAVPGVVSVYNNLNVSGPGERF